MRIIINPCTDPYFNLASEEYFLGGGSDVFMLWRNERAVVIGRNQNAYAELDGAFIAGRQIKAVRRLTGGGAVFHDLGNVNFSFITGESDARSGLDNSETGANPARSGLDNSETAKNPARSEKGLDFSRFTRPVTEVLRSLGADAEESGRNDITVGKMKVSGNAQCVRDGRVLHHGTLLFSADLSELAGALRPDPDKLSSKGIKSVRSRVANIKPFLREDMDVTAFMERLAAGLGGLGVPEPLTAAETAAIAALAEAKYSTWEWNWGESREFSRRRKKRFPFGTVKCGVTLERGVIAAAGITGDFFGSRPVDGLEGRLIGLRCEAGEVAGALSDVGEFIAGAGVCDILGLIV